MDSGFLRSINETFVLLGCYAAVIGSQLTTLRDNLSLSNGMDGLSRNVVKYVQEQQRFHRLICPCVGHEVIGMSGVITPPSLNLGTR